MIEAELETDAKVLIKKWIVEFSSRGIEAKLNSDFSRLSTLSTVEQMQCLGK